MTAPSGRPLLRPSPRLSTPDIAALPDLLGLEARLGVDVLALTSAVDFAFAGGGCSEALAAAMSHCTLPPSHFDATCYARDLYVDELVAECMRVEFGGATVAIDEAFVARVIAHPPT
ncbi:MAG TPA: hypothetical protein ENK23_07010, partial [Sorangium sp.]|nr:hypothetical protein [Sorangium sp.]